MRKMTSNVTKRLLSMALVMVMTLTMALSVSTQSSAAGKSDEESFVTVYVTQDMFTLGGFDYAASKPLNQTYLSSEDPADHPNLDGSLSEYVPLEVDLATIKANLEESRKVYDAPASLSMEPNVLDAIITSMEFQEIAVTGGWNNEYGGYIDGLGTLKTTYTGLPNVVIDGVTYEHSKGSGWNIACTQNGVVKELEYYGTRYGLSDGMVIVIDYSPYDLYNVPKKTQ